MINPETARWHIGIGDPTIVGWLTVVAYAYACYLCYRCKQFSVGDYYAKSEARFWGVLTLILGFLCINKQLDLQSLLTQIARDVAVSGQWYADRRTIQIAFIAGLASVALGMQVWLFTKVRNLCVEVRWAAGGMVILACFVLMRASSFHHMDIWIHHQWLGLQMNWLMELGGIAIIAIPAYFRQKRQ